MTVGGEPCVFMAVRPFEDDLMVSCGEERQAFIRMSVNGRRKDDYGVFGSRYGIQLSLEVIT